jgi:hypothetical protein
MPYWQLFYHIVWTTKNREPLLSPELEPIVYGFLRGKATGLGAAIFALNGTVDHVHLITAIPPSLAVSFPPHPPAKGSPLVGRLWKTQRGGGVPRPVARAALFNVYKFNVDGLTGFIIVTGYFDWALR